MPKYVKKLVTIISIFILLFSIFWCIEDKTWEPKITFLGSLSALIYLFFESKNNTNNKLEEFLERNQDNLIIRTKLNKVRTIGGMNVEGFKISQVLSLNTVSNGIDGALIILIDKKLKGLQGEIEYDTYGGNIYIPKFINKDYNIELGNLKQALLLIVDKNLNLLYQEQLGREAARLDKVYLYDNLSKPTFIITRDYSFGFGSYNGPISFFFEINNDGFKYLFDKRGLMTSLKRAWCIADNLGHKEILYQYTDYVEKEDNSFVVKFERFFFDNEIWKSDKVQESGFWENNNGINRDEFYSKF